MAQPRFNGQKFTNPLNPLGFHSENRYREETPLGSNFMSNEEKYAENVVFEAKDLGAGKAAGKVAARVSAKAAAKAAAKVAAKVAAKAGKVAMKGITKGGKLAIKAGGKGGKGVFKAASSKGGVRLIMAGGAIAGGLYAISELSGLGGELLDNITGMNCDQKALDAGYEDGTDEYTKSVEDCQESAGKSLMNLAMVTGGVIIAIIVLPILLKKKKTDDDE